MDRGKCWPMEGTQGHLGIRLSAAIKPTSFSVEHISKLVATDMLSAPKDLEVYGFEDAYQETDPVLLAKFTYDITGKPLQAIPAKVRLLFWTISNHKKLSDSPLSLLSQPTDKYFEVIQLRVLSNHNNPHYTCIYRFRAHGIPKPQGMTKI